MDTYYQLTAQQLQALPGLPRPVEVVEVVEGEDTPLEQQSLLTLEQQLQALALMEAERITFTQRMECPLLLTITPEHTMQQVRQHLQYQLMRLRQILILGT
jgi:hypothetical protein